MRTANSSGFTLIEVLIVVAIFAIGSAIALPSLMDMGRRDQVKTEARQLKDQLARARADALELNTPVVIIFDANGYQVVRETITDNCQLDGGEQSRRVNFSQASVTINTLPTNDGGDNILQWDQRGYPRDKDGALSNGIVTLADDETTLNINISLAGNINITQP